MKSSGGYLVVGEKGILVFFEGQDRQRVDGVIHLTNAVLKNEDIFNLLKSANKELLSSLVHSLSCDINIT